MNFVFILIPSLIEKITGGVVDVEAVGESNIYSFITYTVKKCLHIYLTLNI
jgi:hypothetical protein